MPPAPPPRRSLTVETVPAAVTEETFQLYKKYQMRVHDDKEGDVTKRGYERFLVSSSLTGRARRGPESPRQPQAAPSPRSVVRVVPEANTLRFEALEGARPGDPEGLGALPCGTYHQLYRIDGELVAVGVVDLVPGCLSSVYCFYDPDRRDLALGKFCALMEVEWALRARAHRPSLRYYYMGFYIHSCPKMRYKAEYRPSELLCPTAFRWISVDESTAHLDAFRFTPLDAAAAARRAVVPADVGPGIRPPPTDDGEPVEETESSASSSPVVAPEDAAAPTQRRGPPRSEDEGTAKTLQLRQLECFAAYEPAAAELTERVPLYIGRPRLAVLPMLNAEAQVFLRPVLQEWVHQCGADLATRLVVALC